VLAINHHERNWKKAVPTSIEKDVKKLIGKIKIPGMEPINCERLISLENEWIQGIKAATLEALANTYEDLYTRIGPIDGNVEEFRLAVDIAKRLTIRKFGKKLDQKAFDVDIEEISGMFDWMANKPSEEEDENVSRSSSPMESMEDEIVPRTDDNVSQSLDTSVPKTRRITEPPRANTPPPQAIEAVRTAVRPSAVSSTAAPLAAKAGPGPHTIGKRMLASGTSDRYPDEMSDTLGTPRSIPDMEVRNEDIHRRENPPRHQHQHFRGHQGRRGSHQQGYMKVYRGRGGRYSHYDRYGPPPYGRYE
jgi:hypothetical protein